MPELAELIAVAACARAGGASWAAAAAKVGRSAETVRRWPKAHPALWARAMADAQRDVLAEARAEAVGALRHQLRSDDDKIKLAAAKVLVAAAGRAAPAAAPGDDLSRTEEFLQSLDDAQADDLAAALDADPAEAG
jgi:hypothetical protein